MSDAMKEKVGHKPGPWMAWYHEGALPEHTCWRIGRKVERPSEFKEIVSLGARKLRPEEEEREANARLIAAAPDLLEAAREARAVLEGTTNAGRTTSLDRDALARLEAAIAKAEGTDHD